MLKDAGFVNKRDNKTYNVFTNCITDNFKNITH